MTGEWVYLYAPKLFFIAGCLFVTLGSVWGSMFDLKDVPNLSSLCIVVHKQSMCILKLGSGFEVMPG